MSLDVLIDEVVGRSVDVAGTTGELLDQRLRNAGDLPGGIAVTAARAALPTDTQRPRQVIAERRLMQFGECDNPRMEWEPSIARHLPSWTVSTLFEMTT